MFPMLVLALHICTSLVSSHPPTTSRIPCFAFLCVDTRWSFWETMSPLRSTGRWSVSNPESDRRVYITEYYSSEDVCKRHVVLASRCRRMELIAALLRAHVMLPSTELPQRHSTLSVAPAGLHAATVHTTTITRAHIVDCVFPFLSFSLLKARDDSCRFGNNNDCDEPKYCKIGTDCSDCNNCGAFI